MDVSQYQALVEGAIALGRNGMRKGLGTSNTILRRGSGHATSTPGV
jgi:hypothetical protein